MIKMLIDQENIAILKIYASNKKMSKYIEQKLIELEQKSINSEL